MSQDHPKEGMKIDILRTQGGITKLVLSGRMDIKGATAADMTFSVAAGANKKMVVDLSNVTFMASLGLRTLMVSAKSIANKGGKMVLLNPRPDVEEVLQTAGVSAAIPVVRDMQAAFTLLDS
jgi:anti-anti-sigma factor